MIICINCRNNHRKIKTQKNKLPDKYNSEIHGFRRIGYKVIVCYIKMNIGPRKIKIDGAGPFRAVGIFEMTAVGQCLLKTIKFDITQRGTIVDHILRNTGNRKTATVLRPAWSVTCCQSDDFTVNRKTCLVFSSSGYEYVPSHDISTKAERRRRR